MPTCSPKRWFATAMAATVLAGAAIAAPLTAQPAAAATTTWLPFDLPSSAALQSSPKKVFANWVSSLPISLDNKAPDVDYYQRNYLSPAGEGGKHAAYGGFLRDRPLGRAPLAGDWRLQDMRTEVRQAMAAGIDGFTVVIYNFPAAGQTTQQWTNVRLMMQAAAEVPGFKIIPMPDMTGALKDTDVTKMSSRMAELAKFASVYRIGGKMVLQPFTSERKPVSWWSSVISTMTNTYATPVTFFPLFQNEQTYGPIFAPITYGMANWGNRDPVWNNPANTSSTGPIGRITKVHNLGDKWMQPISVQDERPREGRYFEAANTQNLRNTWEIARKGRAEFAQLATWNDLPEGSGMVPSLKHGYSFLDLNAYYITWFKTGVAPPILRNAVYLTHRKQKRAAKQTYPQTKLMTNLDGGAAGRDTVEALTFSKSAGTVQVVVGAQTYSCAVDAGVDTCTVPLGNGAVSAKLTVGTSVTRLTSPYAVSATPYVQDFEYTASSSLRQGTSGPGTATTTVVAPTADSFVEQAAPTKNHGGGSSLAVDGMPGMAAYLKFTLPAAPAGKTLVGASLRTKTTAESFAGSPNAYTVGIAGSSWTETTLTWGNRPATTTASIGTLTSPTPNTVHTATLSASGLRASLGQQVTLVISGASGDGVFIGSRTNTSADSRPQLILTFQ